MLPIDPVSLSSSLTSMELDFSSSIELIPIASSTYHNTILVELPLSTSNLLTVKFAISRVITNVSL